jgi:hypothetical protein
MQRDGETKRLRDKKAERQRYREMEWLSEREMERQRDGMYGKTERHKDKNKERKT